jgi:integrase
MNTVEPIRDKKKIKAMKVILKDKSVRDYVLFTLGINTGLRVSDLLNLRFSDIVTESGKIKENIYIRELKTGKEKVFSINKTAKASIKEYMDSLNNKYDSSRYVFKSKKGENSPISRVQAYDTLNYAAKTLGIQDNIGTHTMRKTFGYHARLKGVPIEILQRIFNHSAPGITMRYIGITQDELENVYLDLNL